MSSLASLRTGELANWLAAPFTAFFETDLGERCVRVDSAGVELRVLSLLLDREGVVGFTMGLLLLVSDSVGGDEVVEAFRELFLEGVPFGEVWEEAGSWTGADESTELSFLPRLLLDFGVAGLFLAADDLLRLLVDLPPAIHLSSFYQ